MNYKLFDGAKNNYSDSTIFLDQVLKNRGVKNIVSYKKLTDIVTHDYQLLDRIDKAVECFSKHIETKSKIGVLVDEDADGFCSAAMMYQYMRDVLEYTNIEYILHKEPKKHGLSNDVIVPEDIKLLIIPDASSNDYKQHKMLSDQGIDIIVLDHHQADEVSKNAIVVNNQLCDYPNKNFSGAGIVYKFLQALDDFYFLDGADEYLDLVALANISDVMDVREAETKYYISRGLDNIKNNIFKAIIKKREWDMKGVVHQNNIAFYVTPIINSVIRIGSFEDRKLMFEAFINNYKTFKYKKRGQDELIDESIYDKVAREGVNAKARQKREVDKAISNIENKIDTNDKSNILIIDASNFNGSITGLLAIKIADKYKKPCLMIRKKEDGTYGGSGRNIDHSSIKDLKTYLANTGLVEVEGHDNAFGIIRLEEDDIEKLKDIVNKDDLITKVEYMVDFVVPFEKLTDDFVLSFKPMAKYWGKGVSEPLVTITDIDVHIEEVSILGKNMDTVKVSVDGIEFIKFQCGFDEPLMSIDKDFKMNIIGRCSTNEYEGKTTPQIIIEDYEIVRKG